mmetsp:Transcript_100175/g.188749  ORF Transcript_100175/g.188749 Transcript_100175/m.188749 type:complete len:762 (-) Transcript_100175:45-2330(-)
MAGTGYEAEQAPVVAATISLDELPEGNVDIMSGAVEIERVSHPSGSFSPPVATGTRTEVPGSFGSFGASRSPRAQPQRQLTFGSTEPYAVPVSTSAGGDSPRRGQSLPAMFAGVPEAAQQVPPTAVPRTSAPPRVAFAADAQMGSMRGPPTAMYAPPTQMPPQGSMAGTLSPSDARIQELEYQRAVAQGELSQQRRAAEELSQQRQDLAQQLTVARQTQAEAQAQVRDHQGRMRELADELQLYQRELRNTQTSASTWSQTAQDLQEQLSQARRNQEENARLHNAHLDRIGQLESQVTQYRREQVEHHNTRGVLAGTIAELQNRNSAAEALERQLYEARSAEDGYRRQRQQDRNLIEGLQRDLRAARLSEEQHGEQTGVYNDKIRNLEERLHEARTSEARGTDVNQAHLQRIAFLEAQRASEVEALRPGPPPPPPAKQKGAIQFRKLETRMFTLGFFMILGAMSLPIMCSFVMLLDHDYRFWAGVKWPTLILLGCVIIAGTYVLTAKLLMTYANAEDRCEDTLRTGINTFLLLLGAFLLLVSLMSNTGMFSLIGRVQQGCLSSIPQSELLVDYSQVLYNIRLMPNCTRERSVEDCQGWSDNRYTGYLRYLEREYKCGPLCPEVHPPPGAVVSPPLNAATHEKKGRVGLLRRAESSYAQLRVEESATRRAASDLTPHLQAIKLFSHGTTEMSCYPLVATRLRVLSSMFGGLLFSEGVGLVVISLILKIVSALTMVNKAQALAALSFVGKMKKAVNSKLPAHRW